jgi:hypothetical protein
VRADVGRARLRARPGTLILAAYTVNELAPENRATLLASLQDALRGGAALLIVEPIARSVTPWWNEWRSALRPAGAQEHEWSFKSSLPPRVRQMDRAAGLDHQIRKARTLWLPTHA